MTNDDKTAAQLRETAKFLQSVASLGGPLSGNAMEQARRCIVTADLASIDAQDAARYRWLRDVSVPPHNFYLAVPVEFKDVRYKLKEVDAAIDAARGHLSATQGKK